MTARAPAAARRRRRARSRQPGARHRRDARRRSSASRAASCAPAGTPPHTSCPMPSSFDDAVRVGRHVRRRVHRARRPARAAPRSTSARCCTRSRAARWSSSAACATSIADDRVECTVLPALSFLDVAYARLGIDPVEVGLRLVDGHDFAVAAAGERGPLLVAHTHASWVLSDIKLAVEDASGDEEVVILQRLGTPDEAITRTRPGPSSTARSSPTTSRSSTSLGWPRRSAPSTCASTSSPARCASNARGTSSRPTTPSSRILIEETYELVDALECPRPATTRPPTSISSKSSATCCTRSSSTPRSPNSRAASRSPTSRAACTTSSCAATRTCSVTPSSTAPRPCCATGTRSSGPRRAAARRSRASPRACSTVSRGRSRRLSYAHEVQKKAAKVGFDWPDVRRRAGQDRRGGGRTGRGGGGVRTRRRARRARRPVVRGRQRRSPSRGRPGVGVAGGDAEVPDPLRGRRGARTSSRPRPRHASGSISSTRCGSRSSSSSAVDGQRPAGSSTLSPNALRSAKRWSDATSIERKASLTAIAPKIWTSGGDDQVGGKPGPLVRIVRRRRSSTARRAPGRTAR